MLPLKFWLFFEHLVYQKFKRVCTFISHHVIPPVSKKNAIPTLWSHFHSAYTNPKVLQWSMWYAIYMAGYLQITTYIQVLWKSFDDEHQILWNGAVYATLTALAALFSLSAGFLHIKSQTGLMILALMSLMEGGCILFFNWTSSIYISYLGYVLFGGIYGFSITVISAQLASSLLEDSFALIFGINTFFALVMQTILTFVVVSEICNPNLSASEQFSGYAYYFIIIGILYGTTIVIQYTFKYKKNNSKIFPTD